MFFKIAVSKFSAIIKTVIIMLLCTAVIIFSTNCANGVLEGINFCLKVLVPSLFPFMAIASFIVNSGIADTMGKPLGRLTNILFGLNHSFAPVIILSMIGGYPVGARGIASLYKSKSASKEECERAALFAVCAGPGFLINYVGTSLYGNKTIGIILLVSQIISVIILGIFLKLVYKGKDNNISVREIKNKPMSPADAIVNSALDAAKGMLSICSFVVLFSAFIGIIGAFIPESNTKSLLIILLEVCTAVNSLAANSPIELIAFATGFGGICIHFQIYNSLIGLNVSKLLFFCTRIIQGIITALLTHLGLILFTDKKQVFSTAVVNSVNISKGTVISAAVLLGLTICFLYSIYSNSKEN